MAPKQGRMPPIRMRFPIRATSPRFAEWRAPNSGEMPEGMPEQVRRDEAGGGGRP